MGYAPNALGQPTQVGTYATNITYHPGGAIASFTYGNGIAHTLTQNTRGLPTRSRDASTTVITDDTYAYDENGNVTDITDQAQAGKTTRGMAYDEHDRLTIAVAPGLWGNAAYAYDVQDNLIRHDQGTTRQWRYAYDSKNRLIQINTAQGLKQHTFAYTGTAGARGNITAKNTQTYTFDSANRLTSVTGLQAYRYDGLGRRVQTTDADGKTTFWQYSRAGQVIYASEARKSRNTDYIHLGNTQVAQRHMAWGTGTITVEYQHTDALGTPVVETNAAGQVIERHDYTPWGEVFGGSVDGPGYTGHVMDAATKLIYMQQRFYDPITGRFPSVDPMKVDTTTGWNFSRYNYAANNPYRFTDPDGRCPKDSDPTECVESTVKLTGETKNVQLDQTQEDFAKSNRATRSVDSNKLPQERVKAVVENGGKLTTTNLSNVEHSDTIAGNSAKGDLPEGTVFVMHGHVNKSMADQPGLGDSMVPLSTDKVNVTVTGDGRVGAREIEGGRLQHRMLKGSMTAAEAASIQRNMDQAAGMHNDQGD